MIVVLSMMWLVLIIMHYVDVSGVVVEEYDAGDVGNDEI